MPPLGIVPATPRFPAYRSYQLAMLTVNDMLLNFYTSFDYQSTRVEYML